MSEPIYTLHLTAEQADVLVKTTDMYSRLLCGQFHVLREEFIGKTEVSVEKLDAALRHLLDAKNNLFPELQNSDYASHSISSPKTAETAKMSYDLHQVIRHRLMWDQEEKLHVADPALKSRGFKGVWHDDPWQTSSSPLPSMKSATECPCRKEVSSAHWPRKSC